MLLLHKSYFTVLVRLLLPGAAGRHREDAGAQPGGHVHVRAEHDGGGAQAALLAPDHTQPRALLPQRGALHGSGVLLGGPTGLVVRSQWIVSVNQSGFDSLGKQGVS